MTYANFKTMVLSYVARDSSVYTSGSLDYVLIAMNDARRTAQRQYAFTLNRIPAFAQVSLAPVSLITDFDTLPTGAVLRVVKQIDAVYEYSSAVVSGTTRYYRTNKVQFLRHSVFDQELAWSPSTWGNMGQTVGQLSAANSFVYLQGVNVYHSTLTTPTWLMFDVIEWLPDHAGDSMEDIFLTYFVDWLKYATLLNMNQFLKDDQRFQFDATFMDRLWTSVKQYDAQQGASTGSIDLN